MALINEQSLRTSTFKGFVQFQDPGSGSSYYRMKERQAFGITLNFSYSEQYSDSGVKAFDPSGYNHTFNMTLKVTSDMIDYVSSSGGAPDDEKAISYWIYKAIQNDPLDITFVGKMVALNAPSGQSNEHRLWYKFKGRVDSFSTGWSASGGSQDWVMSGAILEINAIERTNSDTEPSATTNWFA